MSLTFRYKKVDRPRPIAPALEPMIPVTHKAKNELDVFALLDSGADTIAFSKDIAEIIGAGLSGKPEDVGGIGGTVKAVETTVNVKVQQGHERYFIRAKAKVILGKHDQDFPIIIGRQGFFNQFDITFKERDKKMVLKKV
jgi:hypothetical protein